MLKNAVTPAFRTVEVEPAAEPLPVEPVSPEPVKFTPPPSWGQWRVRAFNEASAEIARLSREIEAARQELRVFRAENMAVIGTQLVFRSSMVTGREALERLSQLLREGSIHIDPHGKDVHDRTVADVFVNGQNVVELLTQERLSKPGS